MVDYSIPVAETFKAGGGNDCKKETIPTTTTIAHVTRCHMATASAFITAVTDGLLVNATIGVVCCVAAEGKEIVKSLLGDAYFSDSEEEEEEEEGGIDRPKGESIW